MKKQYNTKAFNHINEKKKKIQNKTNEVVSEYFAFF